MRFDKAIFLMAATAESDEVGNQVQTYTERLVYGEELYLGTYEYYNASVAGMRLEKKFEIYTREYRGESKLKHDDVIYYIIRTSPGKTSEKVWLTCERVGSDG